MIKNKQKIIMLFVIFILFGFTYNIIFESNKNLDIKNEKYQTNYIPLSGKELEKVINGEKILIAVSVIPQAEFAEKIGLSKVITISMIPPGSSHNYDPTPKQLEDLSRAKIYIMLNSGDPFENKYIHTFSQINKKMYFIDSSSNVPLIIINGKKDPHIWMSPKIAIIMVENIFNGIIVVDPINYDYYKYNKELYISELKNLDRKIEKILSSKNNKIFIVYHPAWSYFARDYNLIQVPIEIDGKEPTPKNMEKLIEEAKSKNIKVVFVQEQMSKKCAESISSEINGVVISLNPLEKNYILNMEYMITVISENMN